MLLCVSTMLHTSSLSPICITIDTRILVELYKIYVNVIRFTVLLYFHWLSSINYVFIKFLSKCQCHFAPQYNTENLTIHFHESCSQHHAKRALKPFGTIALLSSITCRLSETSVSGSFKLTLPPPFSMVILWSSTRERKSQKKIDLSCLS